MRLMTTRSNSIEMIRTNNKIIETNKNMKTRAEVMTGLLSIETNGLKYYQTRNSIKLMKQKWIKIGSSSINRETSKRDLKIKEKVKVVRKMKDSSHGQETN
jgi:hypothetical protein